jgi:hypothetical protein
MNDQQIATATVTAASQNEPDTSEPTPERQAELRAAYEANVAAGKPPYEGVTIRTLGEVQWILRVRDWSGELEPPVDKQPPDLRGAHLSRADLSGAVLSGADLSRAYLYSATLGGAYLVGADLSRAILSGADLSGTFLGEADLSGAHLDDATLGGAHLAGAKLGGADLARANLSGADLAATNLSGANLVATNLSGTDLTIADLSGASLRDARMDAATTLDEATLDSKTRLGDVRWNGVPLARVPSWPARLGDEQVIREAKVRRARIGAYRTAARSYRNLSLALRSQGLFIPASDYRLREQVLERKARLLEGGLLGWVFSWLLNLVAGYGERPVRSFFAYLLVLFGFAGAYFALGSGMLAGFGLGAHDAITSPLSALVFSVTSFHGRGFFPGGLALDDPLTVLAAAEAVIGLFIEITFIATFTQRFFGGR